MWRNKYILTALLLCIISLASFGIVKAGSISTAQEGDFVVMTSFYPMYIATMNITDGVNGVEVKNLTNNATGCLHDYQLSTKDLKQLDKADMLIVNGGGMESFLEDVYSQYGNLTVVTATDGVNLLASTDGHEHSHAYAHDEDEHDNSEHTDEQHMTQMFMVTVNMQKDFLQMNQHMTQMRMMKVNIQMQIFMTQMNTTLTTMGNIMLIHG